MESNLASLPRDEGQVQIDTEELEDQFRCSIHKVPKNLRKVNEEAYTPLIIAIGPYHHGKVELADMEEHKMRYKEEFNDRFGQDKQKEFKKYIRDNESQIRRYYADPSNLSSANFVKMILLDSVFIIELFLTYQLRDRSDFLLEKVWLGPLRRDLQLLENQLPYFVLEELYILACLSANQVEKLHPPFRTLSCAFFDLHLLHNISPPDREIKVKHFTDLCRRALVGIHQMGSVGTINRRMKEVPNAVKLQKSGVKFTPLSVELGNYLVDVHLEKRKGRILSFSNAVEMRIPCLYVNDDTECLIRNVMALEQCYYPSETYVCSYIELMDYLIENEEDVDFLADKGIIYNNVGSDAAIAEMINKLCRQIPQSSLHSDIYKDLIRHYGNRWNHARATLKRVYFSNPWRSTATVVAVILLLLTLTQTVFSILQLLLA
ncbi:putative UPF0481 protein At3g02645 [Pistacia vera]|uniref:putative UPF0481 protein At3g02645 n=1 Tax=Pistacia vera TaxID=55513 RepID=UPI001262EA80|nr:putative UPF0481 protein At3g02645 [Pistacia vera]